MVASLKEPLLTNGHCEKPSAKLERAQEWLGSTAPLISQLPTDSLGPALRHQSAQVAVATGPSVSAKAADRLSTLPGGLECAAATALAALLGRYARAGEVAMCLWRPEYAGWAPLKVDLLLPLEERKDEEEESAVIPSSAFASARTVAQRVATDLTEMSETHGHLTPDELRALDQRLAAAYGASTAEDIAGSEVYRALEVAVVFGRAAHLKAAPRHPLVLVVPSWPRPQGRPLPLELRYVRGFFGPATAQRALQHIAAVFEQLPWRWTEPLCNLELKIAPGSSGAPPELAAGLNVAEAADIAKWGDLYTSSKYHPRSPNGDHWSADRPVTALFDEWARTTPDAPAIVDDGTNRSYSYSEVSHAADKVAAALAALGVVPDTLVPLLTPRSAGMVFAILGILRAGGAYVPMDLHWPDERLRDVLEQCNAKVLLGAQGMVARLRQLGTSAQVLSIDELVCATPSPSSGPNANPAVVSALQNVVGDVGKSPGSDSNKVANIIPSAPPLKGEAEETTISGQRLTGKNLVYVFFTSGTTGKPKGVMVEHRGLTHRTHWLRERYPLRPGEGVMQKVAYTFGLSEWDIFWPICSGATMVLAPPGGEKDADYILRRSCSAFPGHQVALAAHIFVPSQLQIVLERFDELEEVEMARRGVEESPDGTWWRTAPMRQVLTCGEPLTAPLAQRLFSRFPQAGLANLYGPTEGEMTVWEAPKGVALPRVPAGSTIAGSKVILADLRERKVAATLEPAEVAFGGPFIARGYLGRPDLDVKAFVPDFSCAPGESATDQKLYLTGDLGRWRDGGELELLGRRDFQIKLRGFRIELGEIETAIRAAGARAAVCVLRAGAGGAAALVAYYEPGADGKVSEAAVRASCQKRLPPYMQPQAIMQLDKLPRNANGKVDRPKLPAPEMDTKPTGPVFCPPETPTEVVVAAAWAEVLGLDAAKVPADTDFQELGGSSLLAGRATALIRKKMKVPGLAGTAIYKHSTVRRLAAVVGAALAEQEAAEAKEAEAGLLGCQALVPALEPGGPQLRPNRPLYLLAQIVGVFALNFLFETQAWSPIWWEAWFIYEAYGTTALIAYLPVAVVGDLLMQVCLLSLLKWTLVGRLKPGKYPLWSWDYYRWWFVHSLNRHISGEVFPLIAETPLANAFLRLNGAHVGRGVRVALSEMLEPDLLVIGDNVTIGKKSKLCCSAVMHGYLHLGRIRLNNGSAVGPCAVLAQETEVPADIAVTPLSTMPGWHGAVGSVSYQKATRACPEEFQRRQDLLRAVFGIPIVALTHTLSYVPAIWVLKWFWYLCVAWCGDKAFPVFSIFLAWVYVHPVWITFLLVVLLQKWFVIGHFKPGHQEWSHWAEFKHWLHARAVESHNFAQMCEMWINTEVLSSIYRLMGARVGKRVQIDHFHAVEHDCITIGDYTVFGTEVVMTCDSRVPWTPEGAGDNSRGYEPVRVGQASNILDHCVLQPGTVVADRAVMGTCSLAPHRSYFPPAAIHSGAMRGRSLHLRDHNPTKALRALEDKAMQDLDNPCVWWKFNAIIVAVTIICKPIPEALWIVTYFGVTSVWDYEEDGLVALLCVTPVVYSFVCLVELFFTIAAKWLIIGKYKAGDHPFFGRYHVLWMTMMILTSGISGLSEALQGTVLNTWVFRLYGAKVGRNCYLAGLAVEYDLLQVGDNVAIGAGCDTTGHTVENMVIKLATTRIGDGVAMCPASFAMPGSAIEDNAVLLEHTQVLKGETVPSGEVWAGMPAARVKPRAPASKVGAYAA